MLKIARVLLTSIFIFVVTISFSNQALAASDSVSKVCGVYLYTDDSLNMEVQLQIDRPELVSFDENNNFVRLNQSQVFSKGKFYLGRFEPGKDGYVKMRILSSYSCSGGIVTLQRQMAFDSQGNGHSSTLLLGNTPGMPATGQGSFQSESDQNIVFAVLVLAVLLSIGTFCFYAYAFTRKEKK